MNKKSTSKTTQVLLLVCMFSGVLSHTAQSTYNLTSGTYIKSFFDRHKNGTIKLDELNLFLSDFANKTAPETNKENYDCLSKKVKKLQAFIQSINDDNDATDMSSIFFKFLQECTTDTFPSNNATAESNANELNKKDSRESKCYFVFKLISK